VRTATVLGRPRPVPSRMAPAVAGSFVVLLALPIFLVAGWRVSAWGLAAVLWVASQAFAFLLAHLRLGLGNLGRSGLVAFGMMFRAIAVMVIVVVVAISDAKLALAAALVYALAYTVELGIALVTYFGGEPA
jgi:hypothetical protein